MQSPDKVPEPRERGTSGLESSNHKRWRLHYQVLSWDEGSQRGGPSRSMGDEKRCEIDFAEVLLMLLCCLEGGKRWRKMDLTGLPPFPLLFAQKYRSPDVIVGPLLGLPSTNELVTIRRLNDSLWEIPQGMALRSDPDRTSTRLISFFLDSLSDLGSISIFPFLGLLPAING